MSESTTVDRPTVTVLSSADACSVTRMTASGCRARRYTRTCRRRPSVRASLTRLLPLLALLSVVRLTICAAENTQRVRGQRSYRRRRIKAGTSASNEDASLEDDSERCATEAQKRKRSCLTESPTRRPSRAPSASPSVVPSATPTVSPSTVPTTIPSVSPSTVPSTTPSASPSAMPSATLSEPPTVSPSSTPTIVPSAQPSASPSSVPSRAPSMSPSHVPTSVPTDGPTSAPSRTPSYAPTALPSAVPTDTTVPSGMPSQSPTTSSPTPSPSSTPSMDPTSVPTVSPSEAPTIVPTSTPTSSQAPSIEPSDAPSPSPSATPSTEPTSSMEPTAAVFETASRADGSLLSTCVPAPVQEGNIEDYTFEYHMYIPSNITEVDSIVTTVEAQLHDKLAWAALTCNLDDGQPFHFVGVSSGDVDTISSDGCDASASTPADSFCVLVNGSIRLEVMYSLRRQRRLDVDPQVVAALIDMMKDIFPDLSEENAPILLEFLGFTDIDLDGKENSDGGSVAEDPEADLLVRGNNDASDDGSGSAYGPLVIAAAGCCFVLLIMAVVSRRRKQEAEYVEHLDYIDDEDGSFDLTLQNQEMRYGDYLVNEDNADKSTLDDLDHVLMAETQIFKEHHDDRNCVSDTCEICQQKRRRPIFITTKDMRQVRGEIRSDLGPRSSRSPRSSSPSSPKTVSDTQVL